MEGLELKTWKPLVRIIFRESDISDGYCGHGGEEAVERLLQKLKKNLKINSSGTMSFGELDTALAEASYMMNYRPMQPSLAMSENTFICNNDIIIMVTAQHPECEEIETNNLDVFQQNDEANNDVEIQENEIFRRR